MASGIFAQKSFLQCLKEWRTGMTWGRLLAEMNEATKTPGMAQIFWMPIQTRTEMLTMGFRTILGIKVFGPDLKEIEKIAVRILGWDHCFSQLFNVILNSSLDAEGIHVFVAKETMIWFQYSAE